MSILRISLKNFVIVPQLELELPLGFSSLTGETGAGKSILIDALQLALGQRADASVVYEGAQQTEIAVEFAPSAEAIAWLQEAGFALDAGGWQGGGRTSSPAQRSGAGEVRRSRDGGRFQGRWLRPAPSVSTPCADPPPPLRYAAQGRTA